MLLWILWFHLNTAFVPAGSSWSPWSQRPTGSQRSWRTYGSYTLLSKLLFKGLVVSCPVAAKLRGPDGVCSPAWGTTAHLLFGFLLQGPQGPPGGVGPMGSVGEKVAQSLFLLHFYEQVLLFPSLNRRISFFYYYFVSCSMSKTTFIQEYQP